MWCINKERLHWNCVAQATWETEENKGVFSKCFHWNRIRWIQWQKKKKKNISIVGLNPRISGVRDGDDTTRPQRQKQQNRSLYWTQFMFQWFLTFTEIAEFTEFNESSASFRENSKGTFHVVLFSTRKGNPFAYIRNVVSMQIQSHIIDFALQATKQWDKTIISLHVLACFAWSLLPGLYTLQDWHELLCITRRSLFCLWGRYMVQSQTIWGRNGCFTQIFPICHSLH